MDNFDKFFNYISNKNNARISSFTSQSNICYCSNILSDNIKVSYILYYLKQQSIWLSQPGFPQNIIIDISHLKKYPLKGFNTFGLYCWHGYNTNPKTIELLISDNNNNKNFKSLGIFELKMRDGVQLFPLDYNVLDDTSLKDKIKAIKIVIKSAFGGNKTYLNQIMMYENTVQEINGLNEYIQNINDKKEEINLPGDLSNSQISLEENERLNKKPNSIDENVIKMEKTKNEEINNFNKNIQNKKITFEKIIKKQYNTNNISNSFSKNSEIKESKNINNKEENDDFINKNPKEEQEEEEIEENEEVNDIIPTSNDMRSPQTNKYERNYSPMNKNSNRNKEKLINEKPNKKEP